MTITGPGTVDDLIADATAAGFSATPRLVTDWVSQGLLDRPARRGKGKRHGSAKGLYAEQQRHLFLTLLDKRQGAIHVQTLARVPIFLWLYAGDDYVPTRQALKALTTWLGDDFRSSQDKARAAAKQMVGQLNHPSATTAARRELVNYLALVAYTGDLDSDRLEAVVRAVFEPHSMVVRRAIGPAEAPLTTDAVVQLIRVRLAAAGRLAARQVTEQQLQRAREQHRLVLAEYIAQLPGFGPHVPDHLRAAFDHPTAQMLMGSCGVDLLQLLGFEMERHRQRA